MTTDRRIIHSSTNETEQIKMNTKKLKNEIKHVQAVAISGGFKVELVMNCGKRIVIKKKGKKAPLFAQLYAFEVNGNARFSEIQESRYFTFAKKVGPHYRDWHLKTFSVEVCK